MEHKYKVGDKVRVLPDTPFSVKLGVAPDDVGTVVEQLPENSMDDGLGYKVKFPSWCGGDYPLRIREKYLIPADV